MSFGNCLGRDSKVKKDYHRHHHHHDERVIIHFDYDCFYAAVFERHNAALKSLPLGVFQKGVVTTMNYEARKHGLFKLQPVVDARRMCPDLVLVSGEDLTPIRNASKELYAVLAEAVWSDPGPRAERLGFDEVFLDVTESVNYNLSLLNASDLSNSFFHLSRNDPMKGFTFDATAISGSCFPVNWHPPWGLAMPLSWQSTTVDNQLCRYFRLLVGSHLAAYLQLTLEAEHGFSSSVGIARSKLQAKLVGSLHKPRGRTTLIGDETRFMDAHPIGRIPGIGPRLSQKLRQHISDRPAESWVDCFRDKLNRDLTVLDLRTSLNPARLEKILAGPGFAHGIGLRVWDLLHGIDHDAVDFFRRLPRSIGIEDSYKSLHRFDQVQPELLKLTRKLLARMRVDLVRESDVMTKSVASENPKDIKLQKTWMAYPKNIRLSTRPVVIVDINGIRSRSFTRICRSAPLPQSALNLHTGPEDLAVVLVNDVLLSLFRKLHPLGSEWELTLINVAVTDMVETAAMEEDDNHVGANRHIGQMFKRQEMAKESRKGISEAVVVIDKVEAEEVDCFNASTMALTNYQPYGFQGSEDLMLDLNGSSFSNEEGDDES